jgi:predicted patatin/cPLA2 family phospholipase
MPCLTSSFRYHDGPQRLLVGHRPHPGAIVPGAPQRFLPVFRGIFRRYPALADALLTRWKRYNETRDRTSHSKPRGKVHIIVPDRMLVDNSTRDLSRLARLAVAHRMGLS